MANIPTIQEIENKIEKAKNGDSFALQELQEMNNKLAKRANQRMSEIEKSSSIAHTDAYDRAQGFLENDSDVSTRNKSGNRRFSQSRNLSINDLEDNLDKIGQFLRDESSLVSKENLKRAEESYNTLVKRNYIKEMSEKERKKWYRFLKTDAWKDIKKHIGTGFLKEARDAIASGVRVGDLLNLYKEYKSRSDVDIFQATDAWVSGKRKI